MKFKKCLAVICLIVCLFCVSGAWAGDVDGNLTANDSNDDAVASDLDTQLAAFAENPDDELSSNASDVLSSDETKDQVSANPKTFTDLNNDVNNYTDNKIYLKANYKFNSAKDSDFYEGVRIPNGMTVYGNGHKIDGGNLARIFTVSNCIFRDIIFVNGNSAQCGGAVKGATVTFINCKFVNNHAKSGGAIYASGTCTVSKCTFNFNSADNYGGAIYSNVCTARQSKFTGNSAKGGGAICTKDKCTAIGSNFIRNSVKRDGGAISCEVFNIVKCSFISNSAQNTFGGGAVKASSKSASKISNSFFKYNSAKSRGGAINSVKCNVVKSGFTANKAEDGGAIYASQCSIYYSRFVSNSAKDDGGAVYNQASSKIVNSVFIKNYAKYNSGAVDLCGGLISGCKFVRNSAGAGGATSGRVRIVNCDFNYNRARLSGGAVVSGNAVNCRFVRNSAEIGGAMDGGSAMRCNFKLNSAKQGMSTYDTKLPIYPCRLITSVSENTLIFTLKDNKGNAVEGCKMRVYLNKHGWDKATEKYYKTDKNGQVVFSIASLDSGNYHLSRGTEASGVDFYNRVYATHTMEIFRVDGHCQISFHKPDS